MLTLNVLSAELVEMVAEQLAPSDLLSLRQTCKWMASASMRIFAQRFFTMRRAAPNQWSLENLVAIAKHAVLGPTVLRLEVSVEHGANVCTVDSKERQHLEADAHRSFVESGHAAVLLTRAMTNMFNCKSISINDVPKDVGVIPYRTINSCAPRDRGFIRSLVQSVMTGISESGLQPTELCIAFGRNKESSRHLTSAMLQLSVVCYSVTSITSLTLLLDPHVGVTRLEAADTASSRWERQLIAFITLFPRLTDLDMGFKGGDKEVQFSFLSKHLYVPNLKRLRLRAMDCHASCLSQFLVRHGTRLRQLYLEGINVPHGTVGWGSLLAVVCNNLSLDEFTMDQCLYGGGGVKLSLVRGPTRRSSVVVAHDEEELTTILYALPVQAQN